MPNLLKDPRHYQIAALTGLLLYGLAVLDFEVTPLICAVVITTALITQWTGSRLTSARFDPRSPLISAISLCLLLRTNSIALYVIAAVIAVGSKFVIRVRGKHIFNPTNGAIALLLLLTDRVWISPGQWGSFGYFAFLMICLGGMVVHRALRSDVTIAFLLTFASLVIARTLYLGDPMAIAVHKLQSGALLLFAFFMISDPKTTPDARSMRIAFGVSVAALGWWLIARKFMPDGLMYALAGLSILVPAIDVLIPARRYSWDEAAQRALPSPSNLLPMRGFAMKQKVTATLLVLLMIAPAQAWSFCGFYVAKADTKLFNKASQVVITRDGNRTVMTMANDFQGDAKDFAIVIPVPTMITRKQINVADKALIDHLDAYTSPRLVEYFDDDPCRPIVYRQMMPTTAAAPMQEAAAKRRANSLGVTIEAKYTVGEYDILILGAKESGGLTTWLTENGYKLPKGADAILGSYIKQKNRFFVAKVNLEEQAKLGFTYLRPIQIAFESPKYMLPIRLGTLNANGPQELFIYTLSRTGRVETTNYRTVKLPTGDELPTYLKTDFSNFYRSMFSEQVRKNDMRAVFLEYAWDMNWCDPCAADPLSHDELKKLGVFWLGEESGNSGVISRRPMPGGGAADVFVTRLHLRYDAAHFPEDLAFQDTGNRENFQARYVLRHPFKGNASCKAAAEYRDAVAKRQGVEAQTLASLTGWKIESIRKKMNLTVATKPKAIAKPEEKDWWDDLWD
jgi:Na+-translocating ferredoxin:NAD+ oxidoreductase RnfD subunit